MKLASKLYKLAVVVFTDGQCTLICGSTSFECDFQVVPRTGKAWQD